MQRSSPVTVAGQRRNLTFFPFNYAFHSTAPNRLCETIVVRLVADCCGESQKKLAVLYSSIYLATIKAHLSLKDTFRQLHNLTL
jgi:hypothetical protein